MSLQIRRGTAAQLANITPVVGELIYTTDTNQVYVGDGSTAGGIPVAVGGSGNVSGTNLLTTGIVSAGGNITGGNINGASVSAVGNILGNYFLGNGSLLTGVNTTTSKIVNGTSEANIGTSNGNANISIGGTSNVFVVASTGVYTTGLSSVTGNVSANYFLGNGSQLTGVTISSLPSLSVTGNIIGGNISVNGSQTTIGNIVGGNINTAGLINASGNITGGNLRGTNLTGTLTTASQPNITDVGTLNSLSVSGNITSGYVNATGHTGTSVSVTGSITGASLVGTISTASQPNITAVGTLGSLSVSGAIAAGNISIANQTGTTASLTGNVTGGNILTSGLISATGNINGANLVIGNVNAAGNVSAINHTGTTASLTGNITGGNILTSGNISATANITGSYIFGNGSQLTGGYANSNVSTFLAAFGSNNISTTGTVTAGSVVGNVINGTTLNTTSLSASGNVTGGGSSTFLITNTSATTGAATGALQVAGGGSFGGNLWVTGNIYAGNIQGITANIITIEDPLAYFSASNTYPYNYDIGFYSNFSTTGPQPGNGYQHTGFVRDFNDNTWKVFSNVAEPTFGVITFDGNTVYDAFKSGSHTVVGSISASGNITGGNLSVGTGTVTVGSIVNANSNAVGNIGSSSNYFNTVFAKSTSAQYADLAENYLADSEYAIGTVVVFGGEQEITVTAEHGDERVAGVISENPAHLMNSACPGLAVALRGRVPVKVIGPVTKGDSLVTSTTAGVAVSVGRSRDYGQAVFAKAIETELSDGEKIIEAVIL
jgi:Major tropism determinant N-terminal domain